MRCGKRALSVAGLSGACTRLARERRAARQREEVSAARRAEKGNALRDAMAAHERKERALLDMFQHMVPRQ